jgi:transcriptional regulator with XRE-family HTH domain
MPFRGDRLAGIREVKGLRRGDLARLTGIDPAGIQHLEDGTTKNPRLDTVEVLAEKLDVTTDYLSGLGPDLPYPRAAVIQALERFKRTEGWKMGSLDDAALARAAEHDGAFQTVAHWKTFVEMTQLALLTPTSRSRGSRKGRGGESNSSSVRPLASVRPFDRASKPRPR